MTFQTFENPPFQPSSGRTSAKTDSHAPLSAHIVCKKAGLHPICFHINGFASFCAGKRLYTRHGNHPEKERMPDNPDKNKARNPDPERMTKHFKRNERSSCRE